MTTRLRRRDSCSPKGGVIRAARRTTSLWLIALASTAAAYPLLAQNWRDLGPKERYDAMQNYWQHQRLPQERQRDVERRYQRWQGLSPEQRARIRQNYERYQRLPPQDRERFQRKFEKWQKQSQPPPPP